MVEPDIRIDTDKPSRLRLSEQIDVLTMSAGNSRRLLKKIGAGIIKDTRGNVRKQQTVSGQPMEPRADKKKRRMMSKLGNGMVTNVVNDHSADVTWKLGGPARIAFRHHTGAPQDVSAGEASRVAYKKFNGPPKYKAPATPAQAKSLNSEGFRRRTERKRGKGKAVLKRVPQKWIRENMTVGQAGLILRLMRTDSMKGKQRWTIKVPKRPILGATPETIDTYLTVMAQEALNQIKRK